MWIIRPWVHTGTCSATAGLVSKTRTIAPMLRAVPMADSPATPPPMTSTFAGGTRPAAVIWPVKKRPKWLAASMTALYSTTLTQHCLVSSGSLRHHGAYFPDLFTTDSAESNINSIKPSSHTHNKHSAQYSVKSSVIFVGVHTVDRCREMDGIWHSDRRQRQAALTCSPQYWPVS